MASASQEIDYVGPNQDPGMAITQQIQEDIRAGLSSTIVKKLDDMYRLKIRALMTTVNQLRKELADAKKDNKENRRSRLIQELQSDLQDQEKVIHGLKKALCSAGRKDDEVDGIISAALGEYARIRFPSREELQKEVRNLKMQVSKALGEGTKLTKSASKAKLPIETTILLRERANALDKARALEAALEATRQDAEQKNEQIKSLDNMLVSLHEELRALRPLKEAQTRWQQKKEAFHSDRERAEERADQLQRERDMLASSLRILEVRYSALEKDAQQLRIDKEQSCADVASRMRQKQEEMQGQLEKRIEELRQRELQLVSEVTSAKDAGRKHADEQLAILTAKWQNAVAQVNEERRRADDIHRKLMEERRSEAAMVKQQLSSLQQQLADATMQQHRFLASSPPPAHVQPHAAPAPEIAKLESAVQSLTQQLTAANARIAQLTHADEYKSELEVANQRINALLDAEAELQELRRQQDERVEKLQAQVGELRAEADFHRKHTGNALQYESDIATLKAKLAEKEAIEKDLQNQNRQLRTARDRYATETSQLRQKTYELQEKLNATPRAAPSPVPYQMDLDYREESVRAYRHDPRDSQAPPRRVTSQQASVMSMGSHQLQQSYGSSWQDDDAPAPAPAPGRGQRAHIMSQYSSVSSKAGHDHQHHLGGR